MFTGFFSRNIRQVFARRAALLGAALGLSFGVMVSPASAAVELLVVDGKLTGANNVNVDGTSYDVRFVDGTCVALFFGCDSTSDFFFTTLSSARLASQALLDQVLVNGSSGSFDTVPGSTMGCSEGGAVCLALSPFVVRSDGVFASVAFNGVVDDSGIGVLQFTSLDSVDDGSSVWALWSPAASAPVPLPATLPLIGLGLGAAALVARRKRSSHQPATA